MSDEWTDDGDDSRPTRRKPSSRNSSTASRRNSPAPSRRSSTAPPRRGEFDFISRLRRLELKHLGKRNSSSLVTHHSSLLHGIGDDAAVFRQRPGFDTVITTDLLVEDIDFEYFVPNITADFKRSQNSPRDIGHKAVAVSLSDVAAMGARPLYCLLSVGVPREVWKSRALASAGFEHRRRPAPRADWRDYFIEEFYLGVRALAARYGVALIGGDTSRTPERVVVDSICLGEVRRGRAVLRAGARAGDQIFVTGALGGAAAGLKILQNRARLEPSANLRYPYPKLPGAQARLVKRQVRPEPRVDWGLLLGERRLASAMIDISDGLSSDLAHLCRESGVGAVVEASLLPIEPLLKSEEDADALALALNGGEDFELLFTVSPRNVARLPAEVGGVHATRIGEITGARGKLSLLRDGRARPLKPRGFEHFS